MEAWKAGEPLSPRPRADILSEVQVQLRPLDLIVQWGRASMLADYLAGHFALHFEDQDKARHVLSTTLNELVENVAKFSTRTRRPASVTLQHLGDVVRVQVCNTTSPERAQALSSRLDRIASADAEELFLEQLEHTAAEDPLASGLGLITLRKDYGARLGAELSEAPGASGHVLVTLHLELPVDAVEDA